MPNLPAPYVSPWREFARNLRSMAADLRLRLQEVWRRNREGDLSVPGFWPQGLAPWFWPLLLVLLLGLVLLLPGRFSRSRAGTPPPDLSAVPSSELPSASLSTAASTSPASPAELPPPPPAESVAEKPPVVPSLDPLLELLLGPDAPSQLLVSARPDGQALQLVLELSDRWSAVPQAMRKQLAEDWQQRSNELGYEQLRLVDEEDRLLGRSARVGVGMILYDIPASA
ncbi:putative conserved membrane protein [Synechococcus sp. A15-127]|uniref:hypothetical protein n=1 Tax=Synechococcus sp. A15-127 TaxID=1050624 RepID=UPI001861F2F9|nr:hypothetical protein [Synechococcus sp. A15-127]QNI94762.1 putative conserved membrane protein [Synechococcus sp. A15-127]